MKEVYKFLKYHLSKCKGCTRRGYVHLSNVEEWCNDSDSYPPSRLHWFCRRFEKD